MQTRLTIVGAGMAGLLAANLFRHRNPLVLEAQSSLPNNHSAVLRFRTPEIGNLLHIPFRKVKMLKSSVPWKNPVADALAYSEKVTGTARSDRSITSSSSETHDRWIAPKDFISKMSEGLDIKYNTSMAFGQKEKVLSTIPMPFLLKALNYERQINFRSVIGYNIRAKLRNVEAYVSLYVPDPNVSFARASITGYDLIIEFPLPRQTESDVALALKDEREVNRSISQACDMLGVETPLDWTAHIQQYAKILPIDEEERRRAIYWASTLTGKAWQLGRYATWRPSLMMDDLIKDIRRIDQWIREGDGAAYSMQKHESDQRAS